MLHGDPTISRGSEKCVTLIGGTPKATRRYSKEKPREDGPMRAKLLDVLGKFDLGRERQAESAAICGFFARRVSTSSSQSSRISGTEDKSNSV
jgi:hypothetical protein